MRFQLFLRAVRLTAVLATLPSLAYAAQGDLMSVTSTIKMKMIDAAGQAHPMPPQTRTIKECQAPHHMTDPDSWKDNDDCTLSDVHRSATGLTAHMMCKGGMASDIKVTFLPGGGSHADIHIHGATGAQMSVDGETTVDAKRLGSCDYHAK
jgi:hypothetical protein